MSSTLAGSLVVSALLNSQFTEFHLEYVDYDLRIQYAGYLPAIPRNLLSRYYTRSLNTYKMPSKPIKQGYKIYGIADHGYLYNFMWSSRQKELQDMVLQPDLTKTGCLVKDLALSLPRRRLSIYMDNYFTSIPPYFQYSGPISVSNSVPYFSALP